MDEKTDNGKGKISLWKKWRNEAILAKKQKKYLTLFKEQ
jgi:hypothetical protein